MKLFSVKSDEEKEPPYLLIKGKGYDGPSMLSDFIKGLKNDTFIVLDPSDFEFRKAFYIQKSDFKTDAQPSLDQESREWEIKVTTPNTTSGLYPLIDFLMQLEINGGIGHSYDFKDSNGNKAGWDGDGSDRIKSLTIYGKEFDSKEFGPDIWEKILKVSK